MPNLVWMRNALRLEDHPALDAAARNNEPVVPVFVWSDDHGLGGASRWWLHHSLVRLQASLAAQGVSLVIRVGDPAQILIELARACNATAVFWSRGLTPEERHCDVTVEQALRQSGVRSRAFSSANYLVAPESVHSGAGTPYKVFTPFWKQCALLTPALLLGTPPDLKGISNGPASLPVSALNLLPRHDWADGLREAWTPGEAGAYEQLQLFMDEGLAHYEQMRDLPAEPGVSRLSPHLHFGEIAPGRILGEIHARVRSENDPALAHAAQVYMRQLYWREFANYLLHHFPHLPERPMRPEFERFPWRNDEALLRAWQRGLTGYPIVDAGMRELWHTGWMHNRVRMIAASFLVKHLLQPWQAGAAWFQDTLADADLANNTLGWQWVSGCGPDAAPYFRIFNPMLQGQKFDPAGHYIRRWLPELARLDAKYIHAPWTASASAWAQAGITLGREYPLPAVDHQQARQRALQAFSVVRGQ